MAFTAVILAGGQSARMGTDKAELPWMSAESPVEGQGSLAAHIHAKTALQCEKVLLSGPKNYGLPITHFADSPRAPRGPVAALYSALEHIGQAEGFFTVPIDAPFFPDDLCARLYGPQSAIAAGSDGLHPVFGWWLAADLKRAFAGLDTSRSLSMRHLAKLCGARQVKWDDETLFANINRPEDYSKYQKIAVNIGRV